jgi:hypothetical protein
MDERSASPSVCKRPLVTELLLLPSGELLVHNLTPTFAEFLAQLGFDDGQHRLRAVGPPDCRATHRSRLELLSRA